ncbi:MAG TPA: hypothetical protein VK659_11425 [Asanoa sp.]|nr:hypothetical protein [Asanoa sp.]
MTFQAVGASATGAVAEGTGAATAMTVAALASLAVTALLRRRLRAGRDLAERANQDLLRHRAPTAPPAS